jgi:predicted small metal-binding protein
LDEGGKSMAEMRKAPQSTQSGAGRGEYQFRCADVGFTGCNWETRGSSPEEVLRNAEQHGREQHQLTNIDEDTRNKVRSKITRAA